MKITNFRKCQNVKLQSHFMQNTVHVVTVGFVWRLVHTLVTNFPDDEPPWMYFSNFSFVIWRSHLHCKIFFELHQHNSNSKYNKCLDPKTLSFHETLFFFFCSWVYFCSAEVRHKLILILKEFSFCLGFNNKFFLYKISHKQCSWVMIRAWSEVQLKTGKQKRISFGTKNIYIY